MLRRNLSDAAPPHPRCHGPASGDPGQAPAASTSSAVSSAGSSSWARFEEQGSDEADDGFVIREDADDFGATLDFAVQAFDGVRRVQPGPVFLGEGHLG